MGGRNSTHTSSLPCVNATTTVPTTISLRWTTLTVIAPTTVTSNLPNASFLVIALCTTDSQHSDYTSSSSILTSSSSSSPIVSPSNPPGVTNSTSPIAAAATSSLSPASVDTSSSGFSYRASTYTPSPSSTSAAGNSASSSGAVPSRHTNGGAIAGGVIAGLLGPLILLCLLAWYRRRRRRQRTAPSAEFMPSAGALSPRSPPFYFPLIRGSIEDDKPPPAFTPGLHTDPAFEGVRGAETQECYQWSDGEESGISHGVAC